MLEKAIQGGGIVFLKLICAPFLRFQARTLRVSRVLPTMAQILLSTCLSGRISPPNYSSSTLKHTLVIQFNSMVR